MTGLRGGLVTMLIRASEALFSGDRGGANIITNYIGSSAFDRD